jgi:adenine-specific DNA-methyltransferase
MDGESHIGKEAYNAQRRQFLEQQGLTVLRFWDTEVYDDLQAALDAIEYCCQVGTKSPSPASS